VYEEPLESKIEGGTPGYRAAIGVGEQLGLTLDGPVLIQETNNTVVWLRPHPIIAKVGTHSYSAEVLVREHAVASALAMTEAPIARPFSGSAPVRHLESGFIVTLWNRLDHDPNAEADGAAVGRSLSKIHEALGDCDVALPSFRAGLEHARGALFDDLSVAAAEPDDREFLRAAFIDLFKRLDDHTFAAKTLHGEPHSNNYLLTSTGIRWIDFEGACRGPLEWDLAFLPRDGVAVFPEVDTDLLALLKALNSARVVTWCWVQDRFPEMRRFGQHHLAIVRATWPNFP
jgi:Ser/Thr protein kinase RdoA (MazF antagonist)